jgi:hypothetical protein
LAVSGYDAREKIFQFLYWDSKLQLARLWPVTLLSYQEKTNYNYKAISMTMFSSLLQHVITKNLPECLFYSNVQKEISSLTGSLQFLPKMCEMEENLHLDLFFSC